MKIHPLDPSYNKIMQFAKTYQKKNGTHGLSNLYLLQSVDENGNIIDEKYGMNLMTNYGFENFFKGGATADFPTTMYFGNGSGPIELNSSTLLSGNTLDLSASASSTTKNFNLPLYYDKEGGVITFVCQFMTASLPAAISGFTEEFIISEYGIGTSRTQLWTHSYTYNSEGEISSVTKRPGVQLNITVYFCMSINKSIIEDAWNGDPSQDPYVLSTIEPVRWSTDYTSFYTKSGNTYLPVTGGSAPTWTPNTYYEKVPHLNTTRRYLVMARMNSFFDRMHYTSLNTIKNNNVQYTLPSEYKNQTTSAFDATNHSFTKYMNLLSYTLNPGTSSSTGYISGFICGNGGITHIERILLPQEESFKSIIPVMSSYITEEDCLSKAFGTISGLEFDQPFITKACCYNYKTGQYDLEEVIDVDNSIWYNEFLDNTYANTTIFYDVNGTVSTLYVHPNICTDDPIIGFKASDVQTIIATDSYWDSDSWTLLTNTAIIPQSEQRRKYYLSSSNVALLPIREKRKFNIRPVDGYTRSFGFLHWLRCSRSYAVSATKDFYVLDNYLYRISQNEVVDLDTGTAVYNTSKYIICYDDSIVTVKDNGTIYTALYKAMGSITKSTFAHSATSITNFMNCQITEGSTFQPENIGQQNANKNGLVMFSLYNTQALLLKIRSELNITETVINDCLCACMISGSDNYAYILKTDDHELIVKNGDNGNTIATITIDSSYANPKYMFGFRDKLYVCDGSTYTLLIDLSNNSISECSAVIPYGTDTIKNIRVTSVNDVMVVYRNSSESRSNEFYIRYDQPTTITSLSGLTVPSDCNSGNSNILRLYEKYGALYLVWNVNNSSNTGNTNSGTSNLVVYEFSKFIYDKTAAYTSRIGSTSEYILFGDSFISQNKTILLSNFITHEVTGTTRTVTAHNNIKNLSGETWTTVITNASSWRGIPPGKKLGT